MISHTYKFIFVHIGRTGGTTLERMAGIKVTKDQSTRSLGNTNFREKHKNFQYYRDTYPGEFDSYFKFTIVRNPFDRFVSAWFWHTQVVKISPPCSLKEFVLKRFRTTFAAKLKLAGFSPEESVNQLDFVGRFENLSATYEHLCQKLGLSCKSIPHTNATPFKRYWDYYDTETVELVERLHREDLELFGYRFGPPA